MQEWIVKRPQASAAPPPLPSETLPHAQLGEVKLHTWYAESQQGQLMVTVTIPVNFTAGPGDVTRFILHLWSPDPTVDTQEGFVGGPGTGGTTAGQEVPGIVIGDALNASKIVENKTAEQFEKPWNPDRPFIEFDHPAPMKVERWRVKVVSASKMTENKVEDSPSTVFSVDPSKPGTGGPDVLGREYAPLAINFHLLDPETRAVVTDQPYYRLTQGGIWKWAFSGVWENDVKDPRFPALGGYDIVIDYPDGTRALHASPSSNDTRHDSPLWDIGAPGQFTIYLVSWSSRLGNPRNTLIDDLTPHVTFTVSTPVGPPGREFTGVITGQQLISQSYTTGGSGKVLNLLLEWDEPADPSFAGVVISMQRPGREKITLPGTITDDTVTWQIADYPTAPETPVTFSFLSVDVSGKVNNYQAGVTPELTVTLNPPALGAPGVEYTSNVTGQQLVNSYYGKSGAGQKALYLPFQWVEPNDPSFSGAVISVTRPGRARETITATITDDSFSYVMADFPTAPETMTFHFLSVDTAGHVNNFQAGVTPELTVRIDPPLQTNPPVQNLSFAADVVYGKDEFGSNTYGFEGTWVNPDRTIYPEYQGVKIFITKTRTLSDRKDLTGVETGQRFQTVKWPLGPPLGTTLPDTGIWIYAISVDVNGVEAVFDADDTPHVGPRSVNAQLGQLKNEAIPELTEQSFAQGIEPVMWVSANPEAGGTLPTSVTFKTSMVYNEKRTGPPASGDNRMYRWKKPLTVAEDGVDRPNGGYKVVGTAQDLVANSLTAGYIATGAVTSIAMATQYLDVGLNPMWTFSDRPALLRVWTNDPPGNPPTVPGTQKLVGTFGRYSNWDGIYALNLRVGPSIDFPVMECTKNGLALNAQSNDVNKAFSFRMTKPGVGYVLMDTAYYDPTYSSVGVLASDIGEVNKTIGTWLVSRGMVMSAWDGLNSRKLLAAVRHPTWDAGEILLYHRQDPYVAPNASRMRVFLTAADPENPHIPIGIVRADRFDAFQDLGGGLITAHTGKTESITVTLNGGSARTLNFRGGLFVG